MGSRRFDRARIWGTLSLVALTGCAGIGHAPGPAANAAYLATIAERQVSGNTGTVVGRLYLAQPAIPTPLTGWTVTLLPLSPTQESALNQARSPYLDGGREPLSPERFDAARSFLNRLQAAAGGDQHGPSLVRSATTNHVDAGFTFQDVPDGRWILLAELPGKVSTLLWASPITVMATKTTVVILNDSAIWLEGLKPPAE
ncbi:MAG: hypothetical protein F9K13_12545 [Candidatus Methylomirabilis oxygeniifera]|uniref:Lipoprotein n=1 Tax=Methylomirabilis oxygeniifera TaxID=671143 RepID=D5MIJ1_METO1|nr:MAG: hypothetical protein F9K13_12545 [Candidatus Methylomirabilis oxyfera]CBE67341.1 exported protein of unknown function [Candidatus Methylomirabilis oxyfera]